MQIKKHAPFFLETFLEYKRPIKKHNSARLVILYAMGGIYLDHDYVPLRRIEPALGRCKVILSTENITQNIIDPTNALMGGVEKHPFFAFALRMMMSSEYLNINTGATGVQQLILAIIDLIKKEKPEGFKLYHPKFFNPFLGVEVPKRINNHHFLK